MRIATTPNPKTTHILSKISPLIIITLLASGCSINFINPLNYYSKLEFNRERAYRDVEYQVSLGPRVPGSKSHARVVEWLQTELDKSDWNVEIQSSSKMGKDIVNIVAQRNQLDLHDPAWVIIGAHYDSRIYADRDPEENNRNKPIPGANDGASGVAVILELARILPKDLRASVWLVFFDAEDNGNIPGWEWILGSKAFVEALEGHPDAAVIVDMVGDSDLNIYLEKNSDHKIAIEIWGIASGMGYSDKFIPEVKHSIIDDHMPFLQAGIPAVDIIDFDYPYYHTADDTTDKVSPESLGIVGDVLMSWLIDKYHTDQ
jgi:glutaminyl-peptide cyclotransferase